jgi:hypothetical protein
MEPDTIECETHGTSKRTYVCQHVATGLQCHERVGFFWTTFDRENPYPDAWCYECEERVKKTGGEWEGEALEQLQAKVLCHHCYEIAKVFHMGGDPWS